MMDKQEPILKVPIGLRIAEAHGERAVKRLYTLSLIRLGLYAVVTVLIAVSLISGWISTDDVAGLAPLLPWR